MLEENNWSDLYFENLREVHHGNKVNENTFFDIAAPWNWVTHCFNWDKTANRGQGYEFWNNVSHEWNTKAMQQLQYN